ncbi:DUF4279 domain-containing protein [Microbulbifer guangxiensis]|uniref:DUF4279 domain-containing protein n=1 Tax=Microbulbifer guangxiensis TaxID=2904249 RepID=UPI001F1D3EBA|nr:DUF4279 domain-containing protein [Microbulbifer guangxiensis]
MDDDVVVPMWKYRPHAFVGGPVDRFTISLIFGSEELDPAVLTEKFGISPTESLCVGEKRRRKSSPSKIGVWEYEINGVQPIKINDTLLELIKLFDPVKEKIREVAGEYNGSISIGIFLEAWNRSCGLDSEVLGWLSEAGLPLDLDIYGHLDLDD